MKNKLFATLLALLFLQFNFLSAQTIEDRFQHLLDTTFQSNQDAVGIMLHLEAPDQNISWTGSVGYSNKKTKEKLESDQPALIASNTKTYVAAAILRLVEMKKITLGQSIKKLISRKSKRRLSKNGYDLNAITLKHLLSHSSGITDYVNDDYFDFVNENPNYKWKRKKQIKLAMKVGKPLGDPGEKYKYADVNFLLLTEVIEKQTKKPFYKAINDLINYQQNQLNATWFVNIEPKPKSSKNLVHQYWNKYNWDSYDLNPSWDLYGGGGLASTTKDLAVFYQNLFEGKIIKDSKVLELIHTKVKVNEPSNYCLGLMKIPFGDQPAYYHGGFWGTDVMYLPEMNITIAAFTLQKDKRILNAEISKAIIRLLKASK